MKYKVGDTVQVKSLEWFNSQPKTTSGSVDCGTEFFTEKMSKYCGCVRQVREIRKIGEFGKSYSYDLVEGGGFLWTDDMLEESPAKECKSQAINPQSYKVTGTEMEDKITPAHYNKNKEYDVYSFCFHNNLGLLEGNCIKYITRFRKKNGKEDLEKAMETLKRLIELEYGQ